jgi:hypothetical protein
VDANRDGAIKLDGTDATTPAAPYQFWLNDNTDSVVGNGNNYETKVGGVSDSRYGRIMNQSDLQDYAHLEVQVPLGATNGSGVLSPGWSATIQYVAASGIPSIDLYSLPTADATALLTYMNDPTAAAALGGTPTQGAAFSGERSIGTAGEYPAALPIIPGTEATGSGANYLNYLFDGVAGGSGAVTVCWTYNGNVVVQNSFNLQLQTIAQMYEQASVINPGWIVNDTANGLGDLRALPPNTISSTATITNPYPSSSPLDDQVIVFVPGWRMKISEMESYADTAFKRLYWQGYTGRFVVFDWPTEWVNTDNTGLTHPVNDATFAAYESSSQNFDRSEQKAWNSAPALYNLLVTLDQQYGYQNVDIIAHSMGNDVASEALRIATTQAHPVPVVNAYIASQAATPADAYADVASPPDAYLTFMDTSRPYFTNLNVAAPQMYNFYNPNDIAVGSGFWDRWNLNNRLKPDDGYELVLTHANFLLNAPPVYARYSGWFKIAGATLSYADPATRYEAFAFAAPSESGALGGTANVGGPFNTAKQVDLNAQFNFGSDHSGQFDGTEQLRSAYWLQVMNDFKLNPWSQ